MKIIHFNKNIIKSCISKHTILTVHNKDKLILKRYLKLNKLNPYKIYVIFNYPNGFEEIVSYYLKYKYYPHHKIYYNLELLIIWDAILNNFNRNNFISIIPFIEKLNSIDSLLDLEKLRKDLTTIINSFLIPFYEQGLFLSKNYKNKKKLNNENSFNDYFSMKDKINSLFGKTRILNIDNYLINIKALIPKHKASIEDKYFFISIYFYNIAVHHYINKNYTISFNMLHRMTDIYFDYLCKIDSLNPTKSYLWNKYEELSSARSSFSFSTSDKDIIQQLNQSRNKLYLTHDLYSINKSEVKQMLVYLKELIKSKSGNDWEINLKKMIFNYKLKPLDLFKSEPSFGTYLKDISNEIIL